jgi:hypothetical protein
VDVAASGAECQRDVTGTTPAPKGGSNVAGLRGHWAALNQPKGAKRAMRTMPDHDMVVQFEAKRRCRCLQLMGHLNVLARWLRVAGRVVVHHDQSRGVEN